MDSENNNYQLNMTHNASSNVEIDKGPLLEFRAKRLLHHMGCFVQNNVVLRTSTQEPSDVITDLDVFGFLFTKDFSSLTSWVDCKSGRAEVLKHICWINGVKDRNQIDNVIFIKKGVRLNTKEYAHTLGIRIFDLEMLEQFENRYNVDNSDWSGSYDYKLLTPLPLTFKDISIPDNKHYKNIYSFYSSGYWTFDPFTQVKKCISGIKQLSEYHSLPISHTQKTAIKWMLLSFVSLFLLSSLKLCGRIFYFNDNDKKDIILNGLMSGSIPLHKQNEIRTIAFRMATDIIRQSIPDFDSSIFNQALKNTPPNYFEAYYNFLLRIISNPQEWHDVLNVLDYSLIEYELKEKQPDEKQLALLRQKITCIKTVLYLLCDITGLSKEMFPIILGI